MSNIYAKTHKSRQIPPGTWKYYAYTLIWNDINQEKRGLSISISTSLLSIQPFLPLNLLLIGRIPLICFITLYIQYLGPGLHTEISFFKDPFTI